MSASDTAPAWAPLPNPFPRAAIAAVDEIALLPTIETAAVTLVRRQVDEYLQATGREPHSSEVAGDELSQGSGSILTIAGEYGTGKSHLALEVLSHIERADARVRNSAARIYLPSPGGTFTLLYHDLMRNRLSRREVVDRVRELYAEVVIAELRGSDYFPHEVLEQIELTDLDPVTLVDRLALTESSLLEGLREQLGRVTDNDVFAAAFALLIQPRFEEEAWRWLCGYEPSPALCERGVGETLAEDRMALEALGVVALLHGRRGHRFVLVIDEMEKLVLAGDRESTVVAVKVMLETFRKAGALLACCGLPEFFNLLPEDRGRIEPTVTTSPLTAQEVEWYVRTLREKQSGSAVLEPFREDAVELIVQLTGGVAREVLKLCYACYDDAAATRRSISTDMVWDAARKVFAQLSDVQVKAEVASVLKMEGFVARAKTPVPGTAGEVIADFWVPFSEIDGSGGDGVAVYVTEPVLDQKGVDALVAKAGAVRSRSPRCEALLVCSGYVRRAILDELTAAFSVRPVLYDQRTFPQVFAEALNGLVHPRVRENDSAYGSARVMNISLHGVDESLDQLLRLHRQQTETQQTLLDLADRWELAQERQSDRIEALRTEVRNATARGAGQGSGDAKASAPGLPSEVRVGFESVIRRLEENLDLAETNRAALEITAGSTGGVPFQISLALRSEAVYSSIGVATLIGTLTEQFRAQVSLWTERGSAAAGVSGPAEQVSPLTARRAVVDLCDAYDAMWHMLPLERLDDLAELTNSVSRRNAASRRFSLRNELQRALEELTRVVRDWASALG